MCILLLMMLTIHNNEATRIDTIAQYEIVSTVEYCMEYVAPVFEQVKETPPYAIEIIATCMENNR